ncbi:MAG: RSP_2647 family RNA methyltransferase [Paracoccaceae bacterium]
MSDIPKRAVVRMRPNKSPKRVRFGYPWVFADEIVLDRRSRAIAPGSLVEMQDADRNSLGVAGFSPASKIAARMLDPDPAASIDGVWFKARIARALALRERLCDAPFYRLVHAEADGLPGVVIDRFADIAVIQPNAAWAEVHLAALVDALVAVTGVGTVVRNGSGRARALEGLDDETLVLKGAITGAVPVPMNGATYLADLVGGQKTGLFFDQRDNHAFAARLAEGGAVLDVFSHVGGFSLAALAAGAVSALAVDGSGAALELAARGAEAAGFAERMETRKGEAFEVMQALAGAGRRFDLVICDPPAFAPSKAALQQGLRAYERVARMGAALVENGGYLVLCSCSHAVASDLFLDACVRGIGRAGQSAQLIRSGAAGADHPVHPALRETGYLKALFFRLK